MRYLSVTETAVLVRKVLAKQFPGVKFSVRSSSYSGGASISVHWIDGPSEREVRSHTSAFSGSGFDGSIDLKYSTDSWLLPDGSVAHASTTGTAGSGGYVSAADEPAPDPRAERVRFAADSVSCTRALVLGVGGGIPQLHASGSLDGQQFRDRMGRDLCALQRVEYQGPNATRRLMGPNDDHWLDWHIGRLTEDLSFPVGATYKGVRYQNEAERADPEFPMHRWAVVEYEVPSAPNDGPRPAAIPTAGVEVSENEEKNGVEVRFAAKPYPEVLAGLKANGFRWSRPQGLWYARRSPETLAFARALVGEPVAVADTHNAELEAACA